MYPKETLRIINKEYSSSNALRILLSLSLRWTVAISFPLFYGGISIGYLLGSMQTKRSLETETSVDLVRATKKCERLVQKYTLDHTGEEVTRLKPKDRNLIREFCFEEDITPRFIRKGISDWDCHMTLAKFVNDSYSSLHTTTINPKNSFTYCLER